MTLGGGTPPETLQGARAGGTGPLVLGRWRFPFFYGWVIVGVIFIAQFVAAGMGVITLGLFFKPMSETYGWSLTLLTGAVSAGGIANMVVAPFIGPLLDRFGARPVMLAGVLFAGLGLFLLAFVREIWHFWLLYALVGALGLGEMGQFTGPVVISKWFVKKRGRAMASATMGVVVGGVVMSPVVGLLLVWAGWRITWGILGVSTLVVMLPLVLIFMRRQPEDFGLLPDGQATANRVNTPGTPANTQGGKGKATEDIWTLGEALRTRSLWLIVLSMNLVSLSASALIVHMIPYLTNQVGMSTGAASLVLSARLGGSAIGRIPWGFIVERMPVRFSLALVCLGRALGALALVLVPFPANIVLHILTSGVIGGNIGLVQPMALSTYFGRTFIGSIQGMLQPLLGITNLAGPLVIAMIYDATGTFDKAFVVAGCVGLLAVATALMATTPVKTPIRLADYSKPFSP